MSARRVEVMCVVCRDGLDAGSQTCLACGALYHEDCLAGLRGRCATLGCPALRPAQATPPSGRPARLVLSAAQVAAAGAARARPSPADRLGAAESPVSGCLAMILVGAPAFSLIVVEGGMRWLEIAFYVAATAGGLAWYAARVLSECQRMEQPASHAPPEAARVASASPPPPAEEGPRGPALRVRPRAG